MTALDFFNKYNGRGIDFDHFYGYQCMDLAEQYNQEVVGAPRLGGNAADVWNNYPRTFYTKIANSPTNVPQLGDIVIWSKALNGFGHIAVCKDGNVNAFTSFDQNWPLNSYCHFQTHNYNYVLGWLRPLTPVVPQGDDVLLNQLRTLINGQGDPHTLISKARELLKT
jgi:hypothetical protein